MRTVAKDRPQTTEMAMGERNFAWPVAKKARGTRPPTVVTVVSMTGLSRTMPDWMMESYAGVPLLRLRLMKSTRMRESLTTTPARAMKPMRDMKLRFSPMTRWPITTPPREKGIAAMTMNGCRNDLNREPSTK